MSKRRHTNPDPERTKKYREQTRAWRVHPDDTWAELERMELTETITALGWSQPRVTRTMNSVASEAAFRTKIQRAAAQDESLFLGRGSPSCSTSEGSDAEDPVTDHGYARSAANALDRDAEVIDIGTLERIQDENQAKRESHLEELIAATEQVRAALDDRVRDNPAFMVMAGKHIWVIRSKIDAMVRELRRKAA